MLAYLTYTLNSGRYGSTALVYSLIADITLSVLLLIYLPAFLGRAKHVEECV